MICGEKYINDSVSFIPHPYFPKLRIQEMIRLIIGNLYNKALRSCIYIYTLAVAGETAEPNWLSGNPAMGILEITTAKNNWIFFLSKNDFLKFHGQCRTFQLVNHKYKKVTPPLPESKTSQKCYY